MTIEIATVMLVTIITFTTIVIAFDVVAIRKRLAKLGTPTTENSKKDSNEKSN